MIKLIINADDCGLSTTVDAHIRKAIECGKITSTTIMANMDDFKGAIELYDDLHDIASFGMHLNLTQGSPLTNSQILEDLGIFYMEDGIMKVNANPYRRKMISNEARKAIYYELHTQIEKVLDSGVKLSHIDSHHFMHQAVFMIPILPALCKEFRITKIRNYRNYMRNSCSLFVRNSWFFMAKMINHNLKSTDWFTSFEDFIDLQNKGIEYARDNQCIELMTHPGGIYIQEEKLLFEANWDQQKKYSLINYNQL